MTNLFTQKIVSRIFFLTFIRNCFCEKLSLFDLQNISYDTVQWTKYLCIVYRAFESHKYMLFGCSLSKYHHHNQDQKTRLNIWWNAISVYLWYNCINAIFMCWTCAHKKILSKYSLLIKEAEKPRTKEGFLIHSMIW
jgi:hypothetical protein